MNAHTNSSRGPTRRNDESDGMVLTHPRREKAGQQEGVLPRSPGAISYVWGQLEDGPELLLTQLSLGRDSLVVRLFPYAHLAQFPDLESADPSDRGLPDPRNQRTLSTMSGSTYTV